MNCEVLPSWLRSPCQSSNFHIAADAVKRASFSLSKDLRKNEWYSNLGPSLSSHKNNRKELGIRRAELQVSYPLVRHFCVHPQLPAAVPGPAMLSQQAFFSHFAQECSYQRREPKVSPHQISSQGSSGTMTCMPGVTSNEDTLPKS